LNSISRACNLLPPSWNKITDRYKMVKCHTSVLPELTEHLNFNFCKHLMYTYTTHIQFLQMINIKISKMAALLSYVFQKYSLNVDLTQLSGHSPHYHALVHLIKTRKCHN
jgi:hypothetical protein